VPTLAVGNSGRANGRPVFLVGGLVLTNLFQINRVCAELLGIGIAVVLFAVGLWARSALQQVERAGRENGVPCELPIEPE
jgi:hypothetical protein